MKIETQPRDDQQVQLTVEFEAATLEDYKRRAARRLSNRVKIPGFRPGKAPYAVIVRQIGEAPIIEEAMDILIDDQYPKIIEESGIRPYGPGSLDKIVSMDPPILEFVVPLQAEVTLGDYKAIRKTYEPPQVSGEDIDEVLDDLRSQRAILEPVERPIQAGDVVTVKLSAMRLAAGDEEATPLINEMSSPFLVDKAGTSREDDWPFQGFSEHLLDLSVTDSKSFTYTYPDTTPYEMLKGVTADFSLEVEEIKARNLPPLDDDFAATVGEFSSVQELRDRIQTNLELDRLSHYNDEYDQEILKELVSQSEYKYPPQMLHDEVDSVINNLRTRLENQNQDLDLYLKARGMDMDALHEESEPVAESRLKNTLTLLELAKVEEIKIDENEFEAEASQTLAGLMRNLPEKESRKLTTSNVYNNLMNNIMANMLTTKAYDVLRNIASENAAGQALAAFTKSLGSETKDPALEADSVVTSAPAETETEPIE